MSSQNNAVTQRLEKVAALWQEFSSHNTYKVCRWLVEPDEEDMLLAFVKVENANEAQTNDLFVRFRAPFLSSETYTQGLMNNLISEWDAYRKYLQPKGMPTSAPPKDAHAYKPAVFLNQLDAFSRQFPEFKGLSVAFLSPDEIQDESLWEKWLSAALSSEIPPGVRIMLLDRCKQPIFDGLASSFPQLVCTIRPQLDMEATMRELASTGDPKHPGVQYRKLFVELTQHASKGNLQEMKRIGEAAVSIAFREQWMYLQVAAYMAMANGYMGSKKEKEAIEAYDMAIQIAEPAWKGGDELGGKLLAQTLLCKGAVLLGARDYPGAGELFLNATKPANAVKDDMLEMEAWRLAGLCQDLTGAHKEAWAFCLNALDAGSRVDAAARRYSTLPYLGKAMLRLAEKRGLYQDEQMVRTKMTDWCGADWQQISSKKGGGVP